MRHGILGSIVGIGMWMGVMVGTADAAPILIRFGGGTSFNNGSATTVNGAGTVVNYNHYEAGAAVAPVFNNSGAPRALKEIDGNTSNIGLIRTSAATQSNANASVSLGSPANSIFPDIIGTTFGALSSGTTGTFTLSNLDLNSQYTFDFLARRETGTNRWTQYTVTGLSGAVNGTLVNAALNTSQVVTIASISPKLDGTIDFSFTAVNNPGNGSTSDFSYLNGLQITAVPEPVSMTLLGLGGMGLLARRRK